MASLVLWTFGVHGAFGFAIRRNADVIDLARANCNATHFVAFTIGSTWARTTHIDDCWLGDRFVALQVTRCEWIAGISIDADARRHVTHGQAFGIQTANARTWIFAFVSDASAIGWAIRTQNAFGSTAFVWISAIVLDASARADAVALRAFSI